MKIVNPTDLIVTIVIKGVTLSVDPHGEVCGLAEEQVVEWKKVHGFLLIKDEDVVVKEEKKETEVPVEFFAIKEPEVVINKKTKKSK
jgi:hypothetical protein